MSNFAEEQALEIEALQSIFEEGKEFFPVSDTEFKLKLVPFPGEEEENHVGVTLHITYTDSYPDTAPDWEFEDVKLGDQKLEELRSKIAETIESSLGMAMVYPVAESCQEFLKDNNVKALSMHEEMMQRLQKSEGPEADEEEEGDEEDEGEPEEEEWKGLAEKALCPESDRITLECFAAWRVKFEEEMVACGVLKRDENKAKTGKQIFFETKSKEEAAAAAKQGGEKDVLVYDATLFGEEDLDDLDDMSGED